MDQIKLVHVSGRNPGRGEYPLPPGWYRAERMADGSWAIIDRQRLSRREIAAARREARGAA